MRSTSCTASGPIRWRAASRYTLLMLGEVDRLGSAAGNMAAHYGSLSDSHVLMTDFLASRGDKRKAEASTLRALEADRGLRGRIVSFARRRRGHCATMSWCARSD
jgi:hypothetical protein